MFRNPDAPIELIDLSTGAPVPLPAKSGPYAELPASIRDSIRTGGRLQTMDEDQGIDWGAIISGSTDSFLRIYSTVTQKPIAQRAPNSVMDYIIGTDAGASQGPIVRQGIGAGTMLLLGGVVLLAIFALKK